MAKKFFYVCAGLLLIAVAYYLGTATAYAQAPGNPLVGIAYESPGNLFAIAENGDTFVSTNGFGWQPRQNVFTGGVQGRVVSIAYAGGNLFAATAEGDMYVSTNGLNWQTRPNVFGSATASSGKSWGALKAASR